MRTWWTATAAVVGLCVVPALTEARDRDRDRGNAERRHPQASRHEDRGSRGGEGRSQRPEARREDRGRRDDRPASGWNRTESRRSEGRSSGWNRGNDRGRQDDRRYESRGRSDDRGRRDDRRYDSRDRRYESRDRRPEVRWRSPHRETFRYRPYVRVRPLRYPSSYRYGYYHRRGWYYPRYYFDYGVYSDHASLRILAEPVETEVYVDGYYAGVVDEFDGIFQRLHVAPGPHEITLRLDGFETWSGEVFAAPGSTVNLRHYMRPGPSNERYEDEGPYEAPPYGYDDPRQ